jgi:hypothetical protein
MTRHILWLGLRPGFAVRVCFSKRSPAFAGMKSDERL